MIRTARLTDIPRLIDIIHERAQATDYATTCTFDEAHAQDLLTRAIMQHGKREDGGTFCLVHEHKGKVQGFLFLVLCRVYLVAHQLRAMDLFWFSTPKAQPGAGAKMLDAGVAWCGKVPGLIEIDIVATDVAGDPRRVGLLLGRKGFEEAGKMYRRMMR